jgi:hypothetical protein
MAAMYCSTTLSRHARSQLSRIVPVDALALGDIEPVNTIVVTSAMTQTITIVPRMVFLLLFESAFDDSIPKQFPTNGKYVGAYNK